MAPRKRVKGYAPWKPERESLALLMQVNEILHELRPYLPLTARQVFYRLVGAYGYPKDENAYERLCEKLNRGRRTGLINFDDLRDDGAATISSDHYSSVEDFYGRVRRLGSRYERDKLTRQNFNIRVYCEAAGMMPQLARVCRPYSVPVYSCSGFDSLTAKYELAQACAAAFTYKGRETIILHLGDFDPSGVSIYDSMKEDVLAFLSEDVPHMDPDDVAWFDRVALAPHQVDCYDLTTYPPKPSDKRSRAWIEQGLRTCQLEALPPDVLAELLSRDIEAYLNEKILSEDREAEEQERRQIARALPPGS
jgi:hypothetical protein